MKLSKRNSDLADYIFDRTRFHTVVFDFDGVFTDNRVWVDQDGRESVCCDRADGLAFDLVRALRKKGELNIELFILSKEANTVVTARARKLGLQAYCAVSDKLGFLKQYLSNRPGATNGFDGLVYLGNDINDLPVMRVAGLAVAPSDAHPLVLEVAHVVLSKKGGRGFVREFIEKLIGLDQLPKDKIDELVSNS